MRAGSRMETAAVATAAALLLSVAPISAKTSSPRAVTPPPGQVKIATVNARQNAVLGIKRFEDMLELVRALRRRPFAFDGGYAGSVTAPDIVVVQEVRTSNLEILEHIFRQRFPHRYAIAGAEEATAQIIYNPDTVTLVGDTVTWPDACLNDQSSGSKTQRMYQMAHFSENATGTPFAVIAVHLAKGYADQDCRERNVTTIRTLVAGETSPVFVAGDFNKRAANRQHECDPDELSDPQPWYTTMTGAGVGLPFVDTVKDYSARHKLSMLGEWTHEQKSKSPTCDGKSLYRRSRIDYIFSRGAVVAEAGADDPGWAGVVPGTHSDMHKYSDHRFVWGRFVLTGPPPPTGLAAVPARGGRVDLSWEPVDGATSYRIYRAHRGRAFAELAVVGAEASGFSDRSTDNGQAYRYAVAPIGPSGGQGVESRPGRATADSAGPQIVRVSPADGSTGVSARAVLLVRFDERIDPASISTDRIRLFRGRKRLSGRVRQVAPRVLEFDPTYPMWRGKRHRVVVKPLRDKLGNLGGAFYDWAFTVKRRPAKS